MFKRIIPLLLFCLLVTGQTTRYELCRRAPKACRTHRWRLLASWYGPRFDGRPTATGEPFNRYALTAASKTLPLGTRLRVCNGDRCVKVRINDRGPYVSGRSLDVSERVAELLGFHGKGLCWVTAQVVQ